jgi:hypothetical protein
MFTDTFWWPLDLSTSEIEVVRLFRDEMETPVTLDLGLTDQTARLLTHLMAQHLSDVLDRDGLPHLAHVVNGWGNAQFRGRRLMERLMGFVHRGAGGDPIVLQRDPEGEFHPWQSFAYAVMAGVGADEPIPPRGITLRALARSSRSLNTPDGHELGHLLFALAYLDPDVNGPPFRLRDRECSVVELMELAIHAHHYGSFEVCRKFHLTEGICAMAVRVRGLEEFRPVGQGFLSGQLDVLFVLGAILSEVSRLSVLDERKGGSLLAKLRESLILGNFLENHFYYAGHLIELGTLAAILGYRIAPAHWNAMAYVVNELNATLPAFADRLCFPDCFLHFGHYRRAITLLEKLPGSKQGGDGSTIPGLAEYAVDFDSLGKEMHDRQTHLSTNRRWRGIHLYELEGTSSNPRRHFLEVVKLYAATAQPGLEPRGKFDHFRRIGPASWPRAFHYELLDYGDQIGAEIHIESDAILPLRDPVRLFSERLRTTFAPLHVEWDPTWWKNRGRLRVLYDDSFGAERVVSGMRLLIEATLPALDAVASALPVPAVQSFAEGNDRHR